MWVGCLDEPAFVGEKDQIMALFTRDGEIHAVIKLFSWIKGIPEYHVVVGRLSL